MKAEQKMQLSENTSIKYLKGVGPKRSELFARLGVNTVSELIRFYPRVYEDFANTLPIMDAPFDTQVCIKAVLAAPPETSRVKGGMLITKASATDGRGFLNLTFFNNKYISSLLEEGAEYLFYGKITEDYYGGREMQSPKFVLSEKGTGFRPVYPQTENLNTRAIEKCVRTALDGLKDTVEETLPGRIIEKYSMLSLWGALEKIHFPKNTEDLENARRRLIFEELLFLQLGMLMLRERGKSVTSARITEDHTDGFLKLLPYNLTAAQQRAVSEALNDMKNDRPMNRLLEGDVGSGKTAVAAALMYNAVKNGFQCALMTPTEILSVQHFNFFTEIFEKTDINVRLLTGSTSAAEKKSVKYALEAGETDIVIGTHALIQNNVRFNKLGLVVTDEQHRFGVSQRAALTGKGNNPHVLVMSATPIPRTLGLVVYGDLDISLLDEMPAGRKPIKTVLVNPSYHERLFAFLKKDMDAGRQCYIVCPVIDAGAEGLVSAEEFSTQLAKIVFKKYKVGVLHGNMKPDLKDNLMRAFAQGELSLLVSTTVIEVGIDVPNATVMVIENAERFGLSQLHQLRGRIGRGGHESTCVLVSGSRNEDTLKRLKILRDTSDGFKIAEEDLKIRGPGDFLGKRQHGLPALKIADITEDTKILFSARKIAESIIAGDKTLERPENILLKKGVDRMFAGIGNFTVN